VTRSKIETHERNYVKLQVEPHIVSVIETIRIVVKGAMHVNMFSLASTLIIAGC